MMLKRRWKNKNMKVKTEFFTPTAMINNQFHRLPQTLFIPPFHALSSDAKILYGLMLSRTYLSFQNGYIENGKVFIYFTKNEIMDVLNCWDRKAVSVVKELQTCNLLEVTREGFASPNKYFLKQAIVEENNGILEMSY